jgi:hypothetical protein
MRVAGRESPARRAFVVMMKGGQFFHSALKLIMPAADEIKSVRSRFDVDGGDRDIKALKIKTNLSQGLLDLENLRPVLDIWPRYTADFIAHSLAPNRRQKLRAQRASGVLRDVCAAGMERRAPRSPRQSAQRLVLTRK